MKEAQIPIAVDKVKVEEIKIQWVFSLTLGNSKRLPQSIEPMLNSMGMKYMESTCSVWK